MAIIFFGVPNFIVKIISRPDSTDSASHLSYLGLPCRFIHCATFTIRIIVSICIPPARYKISHPIRPGRGSPFRQSFILNQEDAFQIFRRIDILPIKKITYYIILSIRYIDPESFFHQFMLTMIYDSSSSSDSSVKITTCQTYFSQQMISCCLGNSTMRSTLRQIAGGKHHILS